MLRLKDYRSTDDEVDVSLSLNIDGSEDSKSIFSNCLKYDLLGLEQ